jgi:thioredoxin reductase
MLQLWAAARPDSPPQSGSRGIYIKVVVVDSGDPRNAQLGCKRDEMGRLVIDERNHTSVNNVYAAGDIAPGPQMAIAAAASGAIASIAIHASIIPETRRLAPTTSA